MDILTRFADRLEKIGIHIELVGNVPWVYLHKVNGNTVYERYDSNHAFTIAYLPIKMDGDITFLNNKDMYNIIRKYR